jgi:YgiT-type zinc finger domain-containing protein
MQKATTPFSIDRKGYHVSWDAVPAWVCTQCGEPYFEAPVVDLIQHALATLDRETETLVQTGGQPNVA